MLVITHQEGDVLKIGEDIRVLVRRARGGWVRLAIDAPRSVKLERIAAEPAAAVAGEAEAEPPLAAVVARRSRPGR
jgi:carbon storage regulator CsrA